MTYRRATAAVDNTIGAIRGNKQSPASFDMHQLPFLFKYYQMKFMLKVVNHLASGEEGRLEGCVRTGCFVKSNETPT